MEPLDVAATALDALLTEAPAYWHTMTSEADVRPYPAGEMASLAVNAAVGSPGNEGPRCVEPAGQHSAPAQGSLF